MTVATVVDIPIVRRRLENTYRRIVIRADMLLCRLLCTVDRLTGAHRQVRNGSARRA